MKRLLTAIFAASLCLSAGAVAPAQNTQHVSGERQLD